LAGRVSELQEVSDLLSGESDRAAMLIIGEAGVGKSRLVAAAADSITRAGVVVLSGWCLPLSDGLPFLPVMEILRALGRVDDGRLVKDALAGCPPFVGAEVARLVPDLAEPTSESGSGGSDDGWRKQRLFEALRRLLDAVAERHALAVVIEDVHWADTSTVGVIGLLTGSRARLGCSGGTDLPQRGTGERNSGGVVGPAAAQSAGPSPGPTVVQRGRDRPWRCCVSARRETCVTRFEICGRVAATPARRRGTA
jgi:AAA ATPase domain